MKTILSALLVLVGIIAFIKSPAPEMTEEFAAKLYAHKAVMVAAFGLAILLNTSKNEEDKHLNK